MEPQGAGEMVAIKCRANVHEKISYLIASMESSAAKPQAIRVASVQKFVCYASKRISNVNPDPQHAIIVVSRFVEHVSIAFHHSLYII